jgi:hypothetical protein
LRSVVPGHVIGQNHVSGVNSGMRSSIRDARAQP